MHFVRPLDASPRPWARLLAAELAEHGKRGLTHGRGGRLAAAATAAGPWFPSQKASSWAGSSVATKCEEKAASFFLLRGWGN